MRKFAMMAGVIALALVPVGAQAADQPVLASELSNAEIAKELSNPNTTLGSLNFPIDYVSYKGDLSGASSQESWRVSFQPVLPYVLNETTNLYVRPNIPVLIDQPVPVVLGADVSSSFDDGRFTTQGRDNDFDDSGTDLGDITFDIAIGKSFPSKTVLAGGIAGTLDTATNDAVGLGQTLLGPEIALAQIFDWGVLGVLVTHPRPRPADGSQVHQGPPSQKSAGRGRG